MKGFLIRRLDKLEERIRPDPQHPPVVDPYRYAVWSAYQALSVYHALWVSDPPLSVPDKLPHFHAWEVADFEAYQRWYNHRVGYASLTDDELEVVAGGSLDDETLRAAYLRTSQMQFEMLLAMSETQRREMRLPTEAEVEATAHTIQAILAGANREHERHQETTGTSGTAINADESGGLGEQPELSILQLLFE